MKNKLYILLGILSLVLLINIININAAATCQPPGNVSLCCGVLTDGSCGNPDCNLAINSQFNNMTLLIKPALGNVSNIPVTLYLCDPAKGCSTTIYLEAIPATTDQYGQIKIGTSQAKFKTNATKGQDYGIAVRIPLLNYFSNMQLVHVQNTLAITEFTCANDQGSDIVALGRTVTCTWNIVNINDPTNDISTDSDIIAGTTKSVTYGNQSLDWTPVGTNGLTFTTPTSLVGGSTINIQVDVNVEGLNSASELTYITLTGLKQTYNFLLDGKSLSSYSTSGIIKGTHIFKITSLQSGEVIPVNSMDINLITPSSQVIPLTFIKNVDDSWTVTTTDTSTPGTGYEVKGTIYFTDSAIRPLPVDERFNISDNVIPPINYWWVYLIIGIVVIIVILIIIGVMFKKKKKRR